MARFAELRWTKVPVSAKRILPVVLFGPLVAACELATGLDALHETAGGRDGTGEDATSGADVSTLLDGGGDGAIFGGDGALDDGVIPDVRALSDVVVPPGSYLLHVATYRAHVTSDISAIECGSFLADGAPPRCDAVLLAGTQLLLSVTGSGSFDGWGGVCTASLTKQCSVTMTSDQYVFASYSLNH
jgi:hypothetical protein